MAKPKVAFLKVADNATKLKAIVTAVTSLIAQNKKVLIAVPNIEAASYLDALLWQQPEESFTPHIVAHAPCEEIVVIATVQANLNQADVLFNLCPDISPITSQFSEVIDLDDQTTPAKAEASLKRKKAYQL